MQSKTTYEGMCKVEEDAANYSSRQAFTDQPVLNDASNFTGCAVNCLSMAKLLGD